MRHKTIRLSLLSLLFATVAVAASDDPLNNSRGFAAVGAYSVADVDAINIFNGNVTIPITTPAYPLNSGMSFAIHVVYTGIAWDFPVLDDAQYGVKRLPTPNRRSNAGVGWRVSIGRLIPPDDPTNPSCPGACNGGGTTLPSTWTYESPDGADHIFYATLHPNETAADNIYYTRDNTYLRLNISDSNNLRMEFPDGSSQIFDGQGRLSQIKTPFDINASVTVNYLENPGSACPDPDATLCWQIKDFTGSSDGNPTRTHWVTFLDDDWLYTRRRANKIILAGQAATGSGSTSCDTVPGLLYRFQYSDSGGPYQNLPVDPITCYDRHSTTPAGYTVPLLLRLVTPDAPATSNAPNYQFAYYLTQPSTSPCSSGALQQVTLPTLGTIAYTYQNYFDTASATGSDKPFTPGVHIRTRDGHDTTYTPLATPSEFYAPPNVDVEALPREFVVTVSKPDSTSEKHYFSIAKKYAATGGYVLNEYGLPITHRSGTQLNAPGTTDDAAQSYFLSSEIFDSGNNLLRRAYSRYEWDAGTPDSFSQADNDRRIAGTAVTFNDDLVNNNTSTPKYITMLHPAAEGFDGLGHYRKTASGDFGFSGTTYVSRARTTYADFNPSAGTYLLDNPPLHSVTLPSIWILGTFTHQESTEGGATVRSDACFDHGRIVRARARKASSAPSLADVVTVDTLDASTGNLTSEETFGGDSPGMNSDPADTLCTASTATFGTSYKVVHEYQYGTRSKSQYYDGSSAIDGATLVNLTVGTSGHATASFDSAGVETNYCYDPLFRVKKVIHPLTADLTYDYTPASSGVPASVTEKQQDASKTYLSHTYTYDAYGRLVKEARAMPPATAGGTAQTATRTTEYDFLDRKKKIYEWDYPGTPTHYTQLFYDPFGRVSSTTLPDASQISSVWKGVSSLTRTSSVVTDAGPADAVTTETYDSAGRLVSIKEPNNTITNYTYDVAGHLTKVCMNANGNNCGQTRAFDYTSDAIIDGRGFLHAETHPENGKVSYTYDRKGHVLTKAYDPPGPHDLVFAYDLAERLLTVKGRVGTGSTFQVLKSFTYGASADTALGRLSTATRENYGVGDTPAQIEVSETYGYDAAGRQNSKSTTIYDVTHDRTLKTLSQGELYDAAGQATTINYPRCDSNCGAPNFPAVSPSYSYGFLSGVSSYATVGYAATGMTTTVAHLQTNGNPGVADTYAVDSSNGMPRPASITFGGWSSCTAAAIASDVADAQTAVNGSAFLSVSTSGTAPVVFQWYDAGAQAPADPLHPTGTAISGATGSTYTTPVLTQDHYYFVAVANACKHLLSRVAHVTVCSAPSISVQSQSSTVAANQQVGLSVTAAGSQLHFHWYQGSSGTTTNPVGSDSSSYTTPALSATTSYWVRVTTSCGSATADSTTIVLTVPLTAPGPVTATATDGTHITVVWTASAGAAQYAVQRREAGVAYRTLSYVTGLSYPDTVSNSPAAYEYRVQALDNAQGSASPFSAPDVASTVTLSPVVSGTPIAAALFEEIRTGINKLRAVAGSGDLTWANILPSGVAAPAQGVPVLAQHVLSLRTALDNARSALQLSALSYSSDPSVAVGALIRVVHATKLQDGVR